MCLDQSREPKSLDSLGYSALCYTHSERNEGDGFYICAHVHTSMSLEMPFNCTCDGPHNDTHTATDRIKVQYMEKLVPYNKQNKKGSEL